MQVFRSIRYARAERFGRPVPERTVAEAPQAICPQRESRLGGIMGPMMTSNPLSEDCLRLSVYTPSCDGKHPVMVWICGGAFVTGSGEFLRYDASRLCEEGNIVVVNISYRVGAWGFLYQPERECINPGLEDQICALEWVRDHISEYGGDPSRVTVCGQSAGAYSIANIIARGRDDLFDAAILFSAPFPLKASKAAGKRLTRLMLRKLAKVQGRSQADINNASISEMLEAQALTLKASINLLPFCPVGERVWPQKGQRFKRLSRMFVSCLKDDAQPFSPTPLLTPLASKFVFRRPMEKYASLMRKSGVKVETEVFSWHPDNHGIGACHTLEIPFLLGEWESWNKADMLSGLSQTEYESRAKAFRAKIAALVRQ